MKNLQQIELVNYSLQKEREKILFEVMRLNSMIEKKVELIKKMFEYQNEYSNSKNLQITRSIPVLYKNLNSFANRLKEIVIKEEKEVRNLVTVRDAKLTKVIVIDQKMKVMTKFSETIVQANIIKKDKAEQLSLDDLSVIKQSRGEYE